MAIGIKASEDGYNAKTAKEKYLTIGETERFKVLDNTIYYTSVQINAYSGDCCEELILTWDLLLNYLCPMIMFYYRSDQNKVFPINHNFDCWNIGGYDKVTQIVRLIIDTTNNQRKIYYSHGRYNGTNWGDVSHTLKIYCIYSENYISSL